MSGGWSRASRAHYQMGRSARNPFVLRLASNYSSAQGGGLFWLIRAGARTAKWTYLLLVAKSFTPFDSGAPSVTIARHFAI